MKYLWGDWFYSPASKKWVTSAMPEGPTGKPLPRAFCQFILEPIVQSANAVMNDEKDKYEKMMGNLGIVLKSDDKNLTGKPLLRSAPCSCGCPQLMLSSR